MKRLLFCALISLVGCTQRDVENAGNALASAAPKIANDGIIVARVEARLVRIDADSALHVAVASHDGAVTLSGKVKSAALIARYIAAARAVSGVTYVDASLTPDARLPHAQQQVSDFSLAAAVRAALVGQAGVNAIPLGVDARAGTIVLSGTVHTVALRTTLLDAARRTSGVRSVVDRLTVGS
ncbi:MAG: BON domain-containing protein [Candidatus Eremiobacteraeota bacterium]|nr:BON domain-containing protein [Candidatus Eremiobacteraeota bacterium]